MRLVTVKTIAEQDVDALHSVRRLLRRQRTALSKQLRALLRERGVNVGCGMARLRRAVAEVMAGGEGGAPRWRSGAVPSPTFVGWRG